MSKDHDRLRGGRRRDRAGLGYRQVAADPHVRATEMLTTIEDEDVGPLQMQNVLFRMLGSAGRIRNAGRGRIPRCAGRPLLPVGDR